MKIRVVNTCRRELFTGSPGREQEQIWLMLVCRSTNTMGLEVLESPMNEAFGNLWKDTAKAAPSNSSTSRARTSFGLKRSLVHFQHHVLSQGGHMKSVTDVALRGRESYRHRNTTETQIARVPWSERIHLAKMRKNASRGSTLSRTKRRCSMHLRKKKKGLSSLMKTRPKTIQLPRSEHLDWPNHKMMITRSRGPCGMAMAMNLMSKAGAMPSGFPMLHARHRLQWRPVQVDGLCLPLWISRLSRP